MAMKVAAGEVVAVVDGATYHLRPSLQVFKTLGRLFGGFDGLSTAIRSRDPEAWAAVIVQGSGLQRAEAKELGEALFRHGMLDGDLAASLLEFVHVLQNGGRPLDDVAGDDGGDEAPKPGKR